jgi:hypothetical protein
MSATRAGIAIEDDFLVLRHLDDAVAQRLAAAVGMDQALVARADVGSRDSVSLDDANPRRRLDRGCSAIAGVPCRRPGSDLSGMTALGGRDSRMMKPGSLRKIPPG